MTARARPGAFGDRWTAAALSLGFVAALAGLWFLVTELQWVSRVFLPTPGDTLAALTGGFFAADSALAHSTAETAQRMAIGWVLASLIGVAVGAGIGVSPRIRAYLQPMLEFIRPLPASAVIPLAISIFGLDARMVLAVIAFGAMWPVLLGTVHGFASVHPRLREVAACLEMSRWRYVLQVGLPNALPDILAGLRLSLTVSLIVAIVGEMLASQPGLGQVILLAARSFQAAELFAGVVLLGLLGAVSNGLLALAERRALGWQARRA